MAGSFRLEGERSERAERLSQLIEKQIEPAFAGLHERTLQLVNEHAKEHGEEIAHAAVDAAMKHHVARLLMTAYDDGALHALAHISVLVAETLAHGGD